MAASAWSFGAINLPIAPTSVKRRVMRKQEAKQILFDFPMPTDTGPDLFELQITGLILGHIALSDFNKKEEIYSGKGFIIASLIINYIALVIAILILFIIGAGIIAISNI